MKRTIAILALCGLWVAAPRVLYADGDCTPNRLMRDAFNEATAAEKSGDLPLAYSAFTLGEGRFGCDGPNPSWKEAEAGSKRTGLRLAKEAEAQGNFHAYGKNEPVAKPNGLQLSRWTGEGAFQWYSRIGEPAEADRMMFRFAQSKPKDQKSTGIALQHFGVANNPEALPELEKQAKSQPQDQPLKKRVEYLKEIQKNVMKNINEELAQEEKAYGRYNKNEIVIGQRPIEKSQQYLDTARGWSGLFGDPKADKIPGRAEKRGDAMMQDERPKSLSYAKRYYELGNFTEKIKKLTVLANQLGDAQAKKSDYASAMAYYHISDTGENETKIKEMAAHLEKETEQKKQRAEKSTQEMIKDEKKQKEFKKEQEQMEKEFGF